MQWSSKQNDDFKQQDLLKDALMPKKVISYSLWGDNRGYCLGAIENAILANTLFPEWTTRFYCADNVPKKIVDDLRELGAEIVEKPIPIGFIGLFWRFEVAFDDPDVKRFIIRDTDSRLTQRDSDMVKEWEESGEPCHIIRDSESHGAWMCGATWAMRTDFINNFRELMVEFWQDYYTGNTEHGFESDRGKFYGTDQEFLSRKIWPLIKDHHLAHIAPHDNLKFTGKEKLAPLINRKAGDTNLVSEPYVGQVCNLEGKYDDYKY